MFESNASMCFIDKVLVQQHKLTLVKTTTLVTIEIIDDWSLFSRLMMHETKLLVPHFNNIVFNIISSSTNLVIFRLSWLALHNPQINQHTIFFHFKIWKEMHFWFRFSYHMILRYNMKYLFNTKTTRMFLKKIITLPKH